MEKYVEIYSHHSPVGEDGETTISPENTYVATIFVLEGETVELAKEQCSIACYVLRIDSAGVLQLLKK